MREQEQPDQWSRPRPVQRGGEPPPSAVEQPGQSEIQRSVERDLALTIKARRRQEENVVEEGRVKNARSRFELTRDQIIFGLKLAVTMFCMIALAVFALTSPEPVKLLVSGGGTVVGIVSLLFRPKSND